MAYPGGKDGAGVWQRLISQIPAHEVFVSCFAGDCAVSRHIRPAAASVLIDLDAAIARRWKERRRPGTLVYHADAVAWLRFAFGLSQGQPQNPAAAAGVAESGDPAGGVAIVGGARAKRAPWGPGGIAYFCGLVPGRMWPPSRNCAASADGAGSVDARSSDSGSRDGEPRVFCYCDPPYLHATRAKAKIYRHEMTDEQHADFLAVVQQLPCDVMVHGYPSKMYQAALWDWRTWTYRSMSRGGLRTEQVWCNYFEPVRLHDYRFVGSNKRQREAIRRRCRNWSAALARAGTLERGAILQALTPFLEPSPDPEPQYSEAGDG